MPTRGGLFARLGLILGDKPYDVIWGQFERALDRDVLVFKEFRALMVVHDKDVCRAQRVVTSAGMPRIARPRRSNDSVASYSFAVAQGGVFATSSRLTDKL
jgi:hypothetical protein